MSEGAGEQVVTARSAHRWLFALTAFFWLSGCGPEVEKPQTTPSDTLAADALLSEFGDPSLASFTGDLDAMRERRVIRALVTPSRTDFFLDSGHIRGIQAELLSAFAARLNRGIRDETRKVRIQYVPVPFSELLRALRSGRGDIAAAFLTVTEERSQDVAFTAPFRRSVSEVIVVHRDVPAPESLRDLAGKRVQVLSSSSYAEHLRELDTKLRTEGLAGLEVEEVDARLRSEDVLEFVNAGVIPMTAIDAFKGRLWARVLPDIRVLDVHLTDGNQVAWAVREDADLLRHELDAFVAEAREGALLGNLLLRRYFDSGRWLENPTSRTERDKLRRFMHLFEKYGDRYGFDPLALAAQAYQESQLDPRARSAAGAVGLMQVLPSTAADPNVGIRKIEDPDGSVHAGAKYLAFLRDRYFSDPSLSEWSQRTFSWAAYNAGPHTILEARELAGRMGLDPNEWFGNVEVATARLVGREPVRYVSNIHRYHVAYRMAQAQAAMRDEAIEELP